MKESTTKPLFEFTLSLTSSVPPYRQIVDQVLLAVGSGLLKNGDKMPSMRQVATSLNVHLNTVLRAYRELELRNMLTMGAGTGTYITAGSVTYVELDRNKQLAQLVSELISRAVAVGLTLDDLLDELEYAKAAVVGAQDDAQANADAAAGIEEQ